MKKLSLAILFAVFLGTGILFLSENPFFQIPWGDIFTGSPQNGTGLSPRTQPDTQEAAADGTAPDSGALQENSQAELSPNEQAQTENPDRSVQPQNTRPVPDAHTVKGLVAKGDTFEKLFEGIDAAQAKQYMQAIRKVMRLRSLRAEQPYSLTRGENDTVLRFEYEMDANFRLVVESESKDAAPAVRVEAIPYDIRLVSVQGTIDDSLFQTVDDIDEHPQLAVFLANLFGAEINFIRDLQTGDSFTALVEKRFRDGEFRGYGRFLAAAFTNRGKTFEAFLFHNDGTGPEYFNRSGENLRKAFLQAPLEFTRISSTFSHSRKHPILGYSRPHLGVDYAAPVGTPVQTVGDGTVVSAEWSGGYGKQVIVRHRSGLESMYSHLSAFAKGIRSGKTVRQGQVIGYVGSTGLSTGPHLDFRLRQNGSFVDPAKTINPRDKSISPDEMKAFTAKVDMYLAYMRGERALNEYVPEP